MWLRMLVPLDGSPVAERAVEMAAFLARRAVLTKPVSVPLILLVRVVAPVPWLDLPGGEAPIQAVKAAMHYLEEQAAGLRNAGLAVETAVRRGPPAAALVEQVLARQMELVVMATHRRSGLACWALGSVAEQVARSTPVPVLLLPADAPATLIARATPGAVDRVRLLVPLDQSVRAEAALPLALELEQVLEAEVRLLALMAPRGEEELGSEVLPTWEAARRQLREAEQYLLNQVQVAQRAGVSMHWSLGYGQSGAKIIAEAHRQQVQLIVLPTEGWDGQGPGRLGRAAEAVIQQGRWPVLLVPSVAAATDPSKEGEQAQVEGYGIDLLPTT